MYFSTCWTNLLTSCSVCHRLKRSGRLDSIKSNSKASGENNYYHVTPHSAAAGYSNGYSSSPELELRALPSHENEDNEEYFEDCQSISESGGG